MMRSHNPQTQEDGFHALLPRAAEHVNELIDDFRQEPDHGLKRWLLELIGEARSVKAFDLFCEQLDSTDSSLRDRAIRGLQALGSPEARQKLFDAGVKARPSRS
jgi:hypothetical protein